ncbi:hypothetical protein BpHYR1_018487 [Brachionus plicatilis]|uniref:Uncharacterized protein n=1 Tax=Brachionus plicatilis TaxID=10195 RepID=A0A3M7STF8_BRAPC|nr:hypothetical protein BpHYR1_018487 [Brachionus plicatilis]
MDNLIQSKIDEILFYLTILKTDFEESLAITNNSHEKLVANIGDRLEDNAVSKLQKKSEFKKKIKNPHDECETRSRFKIPFFNNSKSP